MFFPFNSLNPASAPTERCVYSKWFKGRIANEFGKDSYAIYHIVEMHFKCSRTSCVWKCILSLAVALNWNERFIAFVPFFFSPAFYFFTDASAFSHLQLWVRWETTSKPQAQFSLQYGKLNLNFRKRFHYKLLWIYTCIR